MSKLTDGDGIDGPFERAMQRAEREDAKRIPRPTLAAIELRERQIASRNGIDYDASDRVWLREEALRELRAGIEIDPVRSTQAVDEVFEGAWSCAQHVRAS